MTRGCRRAGATVAAAALAVLLPSMRPGCPSADAGEEKAPVAAGLYESTSVGKGGIGAAIWLADPDVAVSGPVVLLRGTYEVKDGRLLLRMPDAPVHDVALGTVTTTTWTQPQEKGAPIVKERVGTSTTAGIEGIWKHAHYAGGTAYERFRDGAYDFRLPMGARKGRFARVDDTVTLTIGKETTTFLLRADGLADPAAKADPTPRLRRAGDADWYAFAAAVVEPKPAR